MEIRIHLSCFITNYGWSLMRPNHEPGSSSHASWDNTVFGIFGEHSPINILVHKYLSNTQILVDAYVEPELETNTILWPNINCLIPVPPLHYLPIPGATNAFTNNRVLANICTRIYSQISIHYCLPKIYELTNAHMIVWCDILFFNKNCTNIIFKR